MVSRALICGSGSEIAGEIGRRLLADGWDVDSVPGRSLATPKGPWDLLILAHGQLSPIGRFFECDTSEWVGGVMVNAIYPLACLRAAWPQRNEGARVIFMAGPNMTKPSPTYSAYRAGKAMLEALAGTLEAEYPGHRFRVLHPGVVNTKIHAQTLSAGSKAANYERVLKIVNGEETTVTHHAVYLRLKELLKELAL
jgi:NAD(P)-dependent dehydrogenase (short-subunit alcohol dehydrogenase family)